MISITAVSLFILVFGAKLSRGFVPAIQHHVRPMPMPQLQSSAFAHFTPRHSTQLYAAESNDHQKQSAEVSTSSPSSNGLASALRPERIFASIVRGLWKGVTIPFPQLREVMRGQQGSTNAVAVGLRLRDCFLFLLSYFAVGVVSYSYVFEKWSVVDSLYFTSVCFSTVGYGDLCPTTPAGRLFTCFFGMAGIAFLGAAVTTICSRLVQVEVEAAKKAEAVGKRRVLRLFRNMPKKLQNFRNSSKAEQKKRLKRVDKRKRKWTTKCKTRLSALFVLKDYLPSIFIIYLGGAIMGYLNGGWSFLESLYYSVITASTIGLGDFSPQTRQARLFAIFFIPLAVGAAGELLSNIGSAIVERRQKKVFEEQLQAKLTIEHLREMDVDGDGGVDREEYVFFMLKEMGLVTQQELNELFDQFEALDVSKSGKIDQEDLELMAKLKGAEVLK